MKLVLIIGGSRGLGLALAQQYLLAGWQVIEFSRSGTGVGHVDLDLSQADLEKYTQQLDYVSGIEWDEIVLINNAATILPIKPIALLGADELQKALRINLTVPIALIHQFVLRFAQHSARKIVVQVSSGAAQKAYGSWSLYCASKAALDHFMAALAIEQSHSQTPILAIVIDPDVMDTAMQADIRQANPALFPDLPRFLARKANNLLRSPELVATYCRRVIAYAEQGQRYDIDDDAIELHG